MTNPLPEGTPRTPSQPFAFTRDEFWEAAWRAWWMSSVGAAAVTCAMLWPHLILGLIVASVAGLLVIAPVGFVAMLIFAPIVRRAVDAIQADRRRFVHLAVQAAAGLLVGAAVTAVVCAALGAYIVAPWAPAAYAAVPAVVFPWVWSRTERRARLSDAGILPERRGRPDIDAQVEDAIAGRREGAG